MHQLSVVCVTLMVVSVLVQNVHGKRGCAAFGHACYGGHGKRSPDGVNSGGSAVPLEALSLPYSKLGLDKPQGMDTLLELGPVVDNDPRERAMDKDLKYTIYAMLRQLLEDTNGNRPQQPYHSMVEAEQK